MHCGPFLKRCSFRKARPCYMYIWFYDYTSVYSAIHLSTLISHFIIWNKISYSTSWKWSFEILWYRDWCKKIPNWHKIILLLKNPQFLANPYETWLRWLEFRLCTDSLNKWSCTGWLKMFEFRGLYTTVSSKKRHLLFLGQNLKPFFWNFG